MIYLIDILILITTIYFCSIFIVIIGLIITRKKNKEGQVNSYAKKISVIIPVRNEELTIINCLISLAKQNIDKSNFEVLIIDDHSMDNSKKLIAEFIAKTDLKINYYPLEVTSGKKEAIKYGIEKSIYEIIATTDADCILPVNWLKQIASHFNKKHGMLIGPIMFNKPKGFLSGFQVLDMMAIQGIEFGMLNFKKPILNNAANLSYLKEDYYDVYGLDDYNTPSGDDIFLLEKFKKHKKQIDGIIKKDFIVNTEQINNLSGFLHQRIRWSSKAKYYSDKWLIYFSSLILLQNILMFFIYFGVLFVEKYLLILIILLTFKWLIDFILLFLVASICKMKKVLYYFIPVQVIYPAYIIAIWIGSFLVRFEWKGRKFNG